MPPRMVLGNMDFLSSQQHKDLQLHIMKKVANSADDVANLAESREQAIALYFSALEAMLAILVASASRKNPTEREQIDLAFAICRTAFDNFKIAMAEVDRA